MNTLGVLGKKQCRTQLSSKGNCTGGSPDHASSQCFHNDMNTCEQNQVNEGKHPLTENMLEYSWGENLFLLIRGDAQAQMWASNTMEVT